LGIAYGKGGFAALLNVKYDNGIIKFQKKKIIMDDIQ